MDRPNLLLIVVDTLRADHLSCYGYVRKTSPNIDKLAEESVVFKSAYALGIPTHPSFTTILTGLHPLRHRVVSHMGTSRLSPDILMVQELLRVNGYVTGAVDNMLLKYGSFYDWFSRGFNVYSHPGAIPVDYAGMKVQAANVTERALRVLEELKGKGKPFFLFLHYWDPHSPYVPPQPYDSLFWKEEPPTHDMDYHDPKIEPLVTSSPVVFDYVVSQYDGEISYVDDQIGKLSCYMKEERLMDGTAVFITADHGEDLMQHGILKHYSLYETVVHVPLILRLPESSRRGIVEDQVAQTGIAATIYELAKVDAGMPIDGSSLVPVSVGECEGYNDAVIIENTHQKAAAIKSKEWKLICYLEESSKGYPPGYVQLFNVSKDPYESVNLANHELGLVKELGDKLKIYTEMILKGRSNPLDQPKSKLRVKFYSQARDFVEQHGLTLRDY